MDKLENFTDLENDICGDWLDIQKRIQEKEQKEQKEIEEREMLEPKRMQCNFAEFYKILYKILMYGYGEKQKYELNRILSMVFRSGERMPEGFEEIWNILCSPYEYSSTTITCYCKNKFDILFKRKRFRERYEFGISGQMTIQHEHIFCPKCGRIIGHLEADQIVSIVNHNNIQKEIYMEERSNDIKC